MARGVHGNTRFDGILLGAAALLSVIALVLPAPVREPVATALRRGMLAPMVVLQERAELTRRAFLAHDAVAQVRDSAALASLDTRAVQAENERLRQLIGLGARLRSGFVPAEALRGRSVRDETTLILSVGSDAGVQRLSPVVAPEGLVGEVDNTDPTMSHAILWTHPDFRVSAMAEDGSAFGIAQAHTTGGSERSMMELRGVPFRTSVKPGTMIISSGLGGVWPRGIPLGRVVGEERTAETWARTYLIRPAVFPADVSSVMVLLPPRVAAGVDNVWNSSAAADSAAGRILLAGDSMARSAGLAEAQARRAAQDSAAPDSAIVRQPPRAPAAATPSDSTRPAAARPRVIPPVVRLDTARRTDSAARDSVRRDSAARPPLRPVPRT